MSTVFVSFSGGYSQNVNCFCFFLGLQPTPAKVEKGAREKLTSQKDPAGPVFGYFKFWCVFPGLESLNLCRRKAGG